MRRAERVIDVEDLYFLRLHGGAELIDQRAGQARSLNFARCILQPRDRRLRGKWLPCFWTTANRSLHQRIVPQSVEVIPVLVTAANCRRARHDELDHRVVDTRLLAPIGHRLGQSLADAQFPFGLAQQQEPRIGGLVPTGKINCEFLALDGW